MRLILTGLEGTSRGSWPPQIGSLHAKPMWIPQCSAPRRLGWAFSRSLWQAASWTWVTSSPNCLPQPWAGFLLLQGCNSRNKESRSHSASTFPESLKSRDTLEVTDDEMGPKVSPWGIYTSDEKEDGMSFTYGIHETWLERPLHSGVHISERTSGRGREEGKLEMVQERAISTVWGLGNLP